jgi:hypothetical protein
MNNPNLKFRYAKGVGDAVASFLHSRYIKKITQIITGKEEPCAACSARRQALNILFPIPFWRLFFKNVDDLIASLEKEYKEQGYDVQINDKLVSAVRGGQIDKAFTVNKENTQLAKPIEPTPTQDNYFLVSENVSNLDNYLIKIQIFREK